MNSTDPSVGYHGYLIDLINEVSQIVGFDYNLTVEPITEYGGCYYYNASCDRLKNKVKNGEMDMLLAIAWITSYESELMDFTIPFYGSSGLVILMKKPIKPVAIFKFLTVFEPNVWWTILGLYFLTTVVLHFYDLKSPFSCRNYRVFDPDNDLHQERLFSVRESLWFGLMCLMAQGGGAIPRSK